MLYQEYVGHDNNRDGYMLNMIESREITRATLETQPLIFYTQHQSAPFPGRIYLPPYADPISGNLHPLMLRWLSLIGTTIAHYLDDHDLPGSMHQETFDVWYPGYIDNIGNFRHTISFFTETALYRYATPHFYTVDDFPPVRQGLGTEMLYSSPWKGGWWRLADACRYMYGADMAVLNLAVKYREQLQYNKYRAARDTIEKYTKEPPYAYRVPREQHDGPTAAALLEKLMLHGIDVHQNVDDWVILMDQPFSGLVKELFERQSYPALSQRPYDVTGWTLPYQMGVEVHAVSTPLTKQFRDSLRAVKSITLAAPFNRAANASYRAVNEILAAKGSVTFAGDDIVVGNLDKGKLESILGANHLRAGTAKEAPKDSKPLKPARIGLFRPWTASIDEGWTRWILEQYKFPFTNLYNADILGGHLREHYDVIIVPDISERQILDGYRPGTIPERYAGGLGEEGTQELRDFVNTGGTLVTFNNASMYAVNQFKLPVENALTGINPTQFYCSGCLLTVQIEDAKNPLTAGIRPDTIVMFERGPAFNTKTAFKGTVLARYPRERSPLMSGYLLGAATLEGKAAAISVEYGKGRVLLLGFRPQWRGQSHASYKFFMNALYTE
jgi:hypothetical protein